MKEIKISERALAQRINRRLRRDGHRLRKTHPRYAADHGLYHRVDASNNLVDWYERIEDVMHLARDLDVVNPREVLG